MLSICSPNVYLSPQKLKFFNYNNQKIAFHGQCEKDVFIKSEPEKSKTMSLLYSPKYNFEQGINEDGYYSTTVIDKNTLEPVNAYFKKIKQVDEQEIWEISEKVQDTQDDSAYYRSLGHIKLDNNKKNQQIYIERMDSHYNDFYSGIGLRLHQIAVERALQEGYKQIRLSSEYDAIHFHEKYGFRQDERTQDYTPMSLKDDNFKKIVQTIATQPIL